MRYMIEVVDREQGVRDRIEVEAEDVNGAMGQVDEGRYQMVGAPRRVEEMPPAHAADMDDDDLADRLLELELACGAAHDRVEAVERTLRGVAVMAVVLALLAIMLAVF